MNLIYGMCAATLILSTHQESSMERITLGGAAGTLGPWVASALTGSTVRAVGRSAAGLQRAFGREAGIEQRVWNPDDPASVRAAVRGTDTLIYLVGVDYWRFHLHPQLARATLAGAVAEGVRRIVLVGTVYPYGDTGSTPLREDQPRRPHTFKGRMRLEQEQVLEQAQAEGAIELAIVRLPDFFGPGADKSFLHGAVRAAVRGGRADVVGPIDLPHQFVR